MRSNSEPSARTRTGQKDNFIIGGEDAVVTFRAMNTECYGCVIKANMILKDEAYHRNACWGFCKKCGLIVCSGHGRRNESPFEYQCLYCTGDSIQHWRPYSDPDPHSPTAPPGPMEEFLEVFSDLAVNIVDEMKMAVIRYFRENGKPEDSPLDDGALSRAAEAYRRVVGIPQKRQQRVGELVG